MSTVQTKPDIAAARSPLRRALTIRTRAFARDEDGSLIIFGIFMFCLMLAIGGLSFDLMRYESNRIVLQATADRASLAAASLNQPLDPQEVVEDYFAKAGLSEYLDEVVVDEAFGSRRVDITARLNMPLHHGRFSVFATEEGDNGDILVVEAQSTAMEAFGNVEIALVLDLSSSMGSYSRLENAKVAAGEFIDTIYGASIAGSVSTSIVPFNMQVNAGQKLLKHFNAGSPAHDFSHCINFSDADFQTTAISPTDPLEQTLHFDEDTVVSDGWYVGRSHRRPTCRTDSWHQITPWSIDANELNAHIDSMEIGRGTSNETGIKWGAALLDPSLKPVLTAMIADGEVDAGLEGRPTAYDSGETVKIMVVMTDGANSSSYYIDDPDYRIGTSMIYADAIPTDGDWSDVQLSIWTGDGTPPFTPDDHVPVCKKWKKDKCTDWEDLKEDWYLINDEDPDDLPYAGTSTDTLLTWAQVWNLIPLEVLLVILEDAKVDDVIINAIDDSKVGIYSGQKDDRMADICTASKAQGVLIFTIGFEVSDSSAEKMEDCASTPSNFFRVEGLDISTAFQSIAAQLNQLRLIQ